MVAQIAPTAPYMPWKDILNQIGQGLNIPNLASNFDQQLFNQLVGLNIQEKQVGMEAQLGKQAKNEEQPQQPIQMPFLQGNSTGSMLGATTGAQ